MINMPNDTKLILFRSEVSHKHHLEAGDIWVAAPSVWGLTSTLHEV